MPFDEFQKTFNIPSWLGIGNQDFTWPTSVLNIFTATFYDNALAFTFIKVHYCTTDRCWECHPLALIQTFSVLLSSLLAISCCVLKYRSFVNQDWREKSLDYLCCTVAYPLLYCLCISQSTCCRPLRHILVQRIVTYSPLVRGRWKERGVRLRWWLQWNERQPGNSALVNPVINWPPRRVINVQLWKPGLFLFAYISTCCLCSSPMLYGGSKMASVHYFPLFFKCFGQT